MRNIFSKYKEQNVLYKIGTLGFCCGIIFVLIRIAYNVLLGLEFPNELLEPSNVMLTNTFLSGKSPYTLSTLDDFYPGVSYDYPFLNSVLAAAIAILLGGRSVLAHYIISYASIIGTGVLGYLIVDKYSKTTAGPVACAFLFMLCHWRYGFVSASPDGLGLFLYIFTIYIATSEKVKNKPFICAFLSTVCFYTKQYFVLVALVIFVYMLLSSAKDAFKFALYGIVINVVVGAVLMRFWPLYFTYAIFLLYQGCFFGVDFGFNMVLEQMKYLLPVFIGLFIVLVAALVIFVRRKIISGNRKIKIAKNDIFTALIMEIPVVFGPLIFLSRNDGAYLTYFLQLWMPAIIAVTIILLEKAFVNIDKYVIDVVYLGIVSMTIIMVYLKLPMHVITAEEIDTWNKIYAEVDSYRDDGDVYYSQTLAYLCFDNGDKYGMFSHDWEAASEETLTNWENSKLAKTLFPNVGRLLTRNINYKKFLYKKPGSKEPYSLIVVQDGNTVYPTEVMDKSKNYKLIREAFLQTGNMPYKVLLYEHVD